MKLDIYTNDKNVLKQISNSTFEFTHIYSIDEKNANTLVIGDDVIEYSDLNSLTGLGYENIIYILLKEYPPGLEKSIKAVADSFSITMIPSTLTSEQLIKEIGMIVEPIRNVEKSNVVSFFSVTPNIGTTSTTLSVAKAMFHNTNAKIGVLILNAWDDGTDQLQYKGSYLNDIKGKLQNRLFSVDNNEYEFLSNFHMEEKERLYILAGNRNTKMQRLFTKDEIYYLIDTAKKVFDVVLIDAGSHFDYAGMVQSLKESDMNFLVMNQQRKTLKQFQQIYTNILYPLGYTPSDFLMIINQYRDHMILPNSKDIFKETSVPVITTIEHLKDALISEVNQKVLYDLDDVSYNVSINALLRSIAANCSIDVIETEVKRKKKWLLGIGG